MTLKINLKGTGYPFLDRNTHHWVGNVKVQKLDEQQSVNNQESGSVSQFSSNVIDNSNSGRIGDVSQSATGNQKLDARQSVNNQSGFSSAFQIGDNAIGNAFNFLSTGTVKESATGNQKLDQSQSVNNQSGSFADQEAINGISNNNGPGTVGSTTQSATGNQKLDASQSVNNQSGSFTLQNELNLLGNNNFFSTGTVKQSISGNQKLQPFDYK